MAKRYLSIVNNFGKKYLMSCIEKNDIPKYITVKINNKIQIKVNKNDLFLTPKITNYVNFIHKRNKSVQYHRHDYDKNVEQLINEQINSEFCAGYTYLNIANYYGRSDVAFPGFYGFFMKMYHEEFGHGMDFIKFQNLRGGIVILQPITTVDQKEWPSFEGSLCYGLQLEKDVKNKLKKVYSVATEVNDTNVMDFLDPFIANQEESIREFSRLLTRAILVSDTNLGKYLFDREVHETHVKKEPATCSAETGPKLYK